MRGEGWAKGAFSVGAMVVPGHNPVGAHSPRAPAGGLAMEPYLGVVAQKRGDPGCVGIDAPYGIWFDIDAKPEQACMSVRPRKDRLGAI